MIVLVVVVDFLLLFVSTNYFILGFCFVFIYFLFLISAFCLSHFKVVLFVWLIFAFVFVAVVVVAGVCIYKLEFLAQDHVEFVVVESRYNNLYICIYYNYKLFFLICCYCSIGKEHKCRHSFRYMYFCMYTYICIYIYTYAARSYVRIYLMVLCSFFCNNTTKNKIFFCFFIFWYPSFSLSFSVCVNARRGCVSCVKIAGVLGAPLDKRRQQRRRRRRFYSKKMLLYAF